MGCMDKWGWNCSIYHGLLHNKMVWASEAKVLFGKIPNYGCWFGGDSKQVFINNFDS